MPLSYLYHHHLAPPELRARALPERYVDMRQLPPDAIDTKAALALPPLIKGYLRLGGFVGDGAVIDHQFNTTDVCIVVKTDWSPTDTTRHYTAAISRATGKERPIRMTRSGVRSTASTAMPPGAARRDLTLGLADRAAVRLARLSASQLRSPCRCSWR